MVKVRYHPKELYEACRLSRLITTADVRLYADPDGSSLHAAHPSGKRSLSVALQGMSDEHGVITVPLNRLTSFCKFCDGDEVVITSKFDIIEVQSGSAVMTVKYVEPNDIAPQRNIESLSMSLGESFMSALRKVVPFTTPDDERPVLHTVLMESDGGGNMSLVAADGYRLVRAMVEGCDTPKMSVLIPRKTCILLPKLLNGRVQLGLSSDNSVIFSNGRVNLRTSTVQAVFPNYRGLIPTSKPNWTVNCPPASLLRVIKQLGTSSYIVRLSPKDGLLNISMSDSGDKFLASIPADMSGEGKVALDSKLLASTLELFSEARIEVTAPSSPVKITGKPEGIVAVVMPMFVSWD